MNNLNATLIGYWLSTRRGSKARRCVYQGHNQLSSMKARHFENCSSRWQQPV